MEKPITDIILIFTESSKAPSGYVLLQRTTSGILAANLNSGTAGKQMYICYAREEGKPPITGLSIFYPSLDVKPPPNYEVILETPNGEPASLNTGNNGIEAFLCFSTSEGNPITGLSLINESEDYVLPEDFRVLELSPTGHKANLNKKTDGDRLFLSYKGGNKSNFGFVKGNVLHFKFRKRYFEDIFFKIFLNEFILIFFYFLECKNPNQGLLRVEVIEAKNLVAADLGGTSDPFVEIIIGDDRPKKGAPTKYSRVIEKTLTPRWEEYFIFRNVDRSQILTINVYDKDKIEITPEFLGRIQISLKNLVLGKPVQQWIPLQRIEKGEILINLHALDFGVSADKEVKPLLALEVSDYSSSQNVIIGGLAGVGGFGLNTVSAIGGIGVKGVTGVGELGAKGVSGVTGLFRSKSKLERSASKIEPPEPLIDNNGPRVPVSKNGVLQIGVLKKKRFCVLKTDSFIVFKTKKAFDTSQTPNDIFPLGEIALSLTKHSSHCFDILHHNNSFTFRCSSTEELQEWKSAINNNINCLRE